MMLNTLFEQDKIRNRIALLENELNTLEMKLEKDRHERASWKPEQRIAALLHDLFCRSQMCGFSKDNWQYDENNRYLEMALMLITLQQCDLTVEGRLTQMIQIMYNYPRL